MRTLEQLLSQHSERVIFESTVGSQAYGTALPGSDEDIKGIYVVPELIYLTLEPLPTQVSDEKGGYRLLNLSPLSGAGPHGQPQHYRAALYAERVHPATFSCFRLTGRKSVAVYHQTGLRIPRRLCPSPNQESARSKQMG